MFNALKNRKNSLQPSNQQRDIRRKSLVADNESSRLILIDDGAIDNYNKLITKANDKSKNVYQKEEATFRNMLSKIESGYSLVAPRSTEYEFKKLKK